VTKELDSRVVGRFMVLVHPKGEMSEAAGAAFHAGMRAAKGKIDVLLVWADGTMSPKQRTLASQLQKEMGFKVVTFTSSRMTRTMLTALGWLGMPVEGHDKSELAAALARLGATVADRAAVEAAITEMEHGLGVSRA
jgi:hypothetical protein